MTERAKALEIVSQDRLLNPQKCVAGIADRCEFDERFLRIPGFVRINHDLRPGWNDLPQEIETTHVAPEVGVADLDLERLIAKAGRMRKQRAEGAVAQMEVQATGIGAHPVATASQGACAAASQPPWRQGPTALEGLHETAAKSRAAFGRAGH